MAIHKLQDTQIKNATCTTATVRKMSDGGGLYLWIYPDGRRYWRYRYTIDGREQALSVGTYPDTTLVQARVKAAELRKQADPAALRKAEKQTKTVDTLNTFESVAIGWLAKQKHWTEKYANDSQVRFERYLFPKIGSMPIAQISKRDVVTVIESIEREGSSGLAHRLVPVFSRVFRHAMAKGLCSHNPLGDLDPRDLISKPEKRKHPAVTTGALPLLLRKVDAYDNRQVSLALKLIFLIFTRANEALKGEWSEIDFDAALWRIPETRMKKRLPLLVPLAP